MLSVGVAFPATGTALATGLTVWLLTNSAWRSALVVLVLAAALVSAWMIAAEGIWLVPATVTCVLAIVLLLDPRGTLSSGAAAGPLGYANGKAALYAQGIAAAAMLAGRLRSKRARWAAWAAAAVFALVPLVSRSLTATLAVAGFVGLQLLPRRWAHLAIVGCGIAFVAVLTTTLLVASGNVDVDGIGLDGRRVELWRDAWTVMAESPVGGAGKGGWIETSVVASDDADAVWVHNEFLELGAEYGFPALVVAVAIVLWLLWGLGRAARGDPRTCLLGAGAVTMFAVHACLDYVGHFPVIPILSALIAGTALRAGRRATIRMVRSERPWHSSRA